MLQITQLAAALACNSMTYEVNMQCMTLAHAWSHPDIIGAASAGFRSVHGQLGQQHVRRYCRTHGVRHYAWHGSCHENLRFAQSRLYHLARLIRESMSQQNYLGSFGMLSDSLNAG